MPSPLEQNIDRLKNELEKDGAPEKPSKPDPDITKMFKTNPSQMLAQMGETNAEKN